MRTTSNPSPASVQPDQAQLKSLACTNMRLRQLVRRVSSHYDAEMAKAGLKTTQYSLLTHVNKLGPLRPGELAKIMGLSASTLTRNLKPVMDAGWVTMSAGSDARSRMVVITPDGRAKRDEARLRWKAAQESLHALLGARTVLALHALVDDVLDVLVSDEPCGPND